MDVRFEGKRLTLGNKTLELEVLIREVERFDELVVIRFAYDEYDQDDLNGERNVLALDTAGNVVWRIQQAPSVPVVSGKRVLTSYVGIDTETGNPDRPLEAHDSSGLTWRVDPETGEVSEPIFTK